MSSAPSLPSSALTPEQARDYAFAMQFQSAPAAHTPTSYKLSVTHQNNGDIHLIDRSSGRGELLADFGNCPDLFSARLAIARDIATSYNTHAQLVSERDNAVTKCRDFEAAFLTVQKERDTLRAALEDAGK